MDRDLVLDWARRADAGPFASLGVIDRLVYDCWEPMASLAACAALTTRVRLVTMVVIGPLRPAALLGRQAGSLDAIARGRLVLGLGLGARHDDYEAAGVPTRSRGAALTRQLVELRDAWEDGAGHGPELLVGGGGSAAFARAARHADGYVHGGGPPRAFAGAAARVRAAWADAGRPGAPRLWGQAYFALGDEATLASGAAYLRDYYRFTGGFEERIAAGNLTTPAAIRALVGGYEDEGCDELVLLPTVARPDQLDRLADAIA